MKNKSLLITMVVLIHSLSLIAQETGKFTDARDGKTYKTVKIGTQTWMAENLAFKTGEGCWSYNNDESNVPYFGYLYNWETANKVSPAGWHLPSDAEWKLLTAFLGGADAAGSKMKAKHTDTDQTSNGSNTSGFEGFPAGWYDYLNGTSISLNTWWGWWSSTEENSKKTRKANRADDAWSCWMISFAGNAKITLFEKVNGMSVRCIMD